MKDEILNFFDGETSSLSWNDIYNCFVEILPSRLGRSRMYDIVSQDDGNGGSAECNNREYGGYIDEYGFVLEVEQGDVKSPCINESVNITLPKGYSTFHSHPSGNCESYIMNGELRTPYFVQGPSDQDYMIAGNRICYVFGRRDNYVYIYNNKGTQAIIQASVFISPKKFVKP